MSSHPGKEVWSDASGSWGCAAFFANKRFQIRWGDFPHFEQAFIAAKEMLPILAAAAVWGRRWCRNVVCFHCDNAAVVSSMRGG